MSTENLLTTGNVQILNPIIITRDKSVHIKPANNNIKVQTLKNATSNLSGQSKNTECKHSLLLLLSNVVTMCKNTEMISSKKYNHVVQ